MYTQKQNSKTIQNARKIMAMITNHEEEEIVSSPP